MSIVATNNGVAAAARKVASHLTGYPDDLPETRMIAAAFDFFAEHLDGATDVAPTFHGARIPTSELLTKAAGTIDLLLSGRGVDRRNGYSWPNLVRDLHERAAAFKAIEDTS